MKRMSAGWAGEFFVGGEHRRERGGGLEGAGEVVERRGGFVTGGVFAEEVNAHGARLRRGDEDAVVEVVRVAGEGERGGVGRVRRRGENARGSGRNLRGDGVGFRRVLPREGEIAEGGIAGVGETDADEGVRAPVVFAGSEGDTEVVVGGGIEAVDAEGDFSRPGDGTEGIKLGAFLKIGDEMDAFFERGRAGIKTRHRGDEGAVELCGVPGGRKCSETCLDGCEAICRCVAIFLEAPQRCEFAIKDGKRDAVGEFGGFELLFGLGDGLLPQVTAAHRSAAVEQDERGAVRRCGGVGFALNEGPREHEREQDERKAAQQKQQPIFEAAFADGHGRLRVEEEQRAELHAILRRTTTQVQQDRRDDRSGTGEVKWGRASSWGCLGSSSSSYSNSSSIIWVRRHTACASKNGRTENGGTENGGTENCKME
jgi:hypothetical protein